MTLTMTVVAMHCGWLLELPHRLLELPHGLLDTWFAASTPVVRGEQMPPVEGWELQRLNEVSQLLHHCKCGLWHLVHRGPGGPGIPWGCCMDACNPLLRRRPCQVLRLLLLLLGLLLVHHGIPWGCCMNACNHLLCRRVRLLLWPAAAAAAVVAGAGRSGHK